MKELSIEQKAKAYDEVREKITIRFGSNVAEEIFSQFEISEDERIRKKLIEAVKGDMVVGGTKDKQLAIAWLEKQEGCEYIKKDWLEHIKQSWYKEGFIDGKYSGETSKEWTINDAVILKELIDFLENGTAKLQHNLTLYANWLKIQFTPTEKQGEQKSTDKVEPKFKVGDKIQYSKGCGTIMTIEKIENCEYIFANNMGHTTIEDGNKWYLLEQKPEWSEEDERMLDIILNDINYAQKNFSSSKLTPYARKVDWLKSRRPQNDITDEELAQAKKEAYNDTLDKIEYHSGEPTFDDGWGAAIWYLKNRNAQPQNTWKPSEEQMKAIEHICDGDYKVDLDILDSIYRDFKKLREE